jgi:hypothetical protein
VTVLDHPLLLGGHTEADLPKANPTSARQEKWKRRLISEGTFVFLISLAIYVVVAVLLDFKYHVFPADAVSRTANGFYVVFSRDPHIAAVGFVWNPLPSIVTIVPLLFKGLWGALARNNMAGSLVTAVTMAGAVYQMWCCFVDWGVRRGTRTLLLILFAMNPMILYYGGNGMSEAMFIFTLVATTRFLARWIRTGDMRALVAAAIWLALAYLTRYESVGAALLIVPLVCGVSYIRAKGTEGTTKFRTAISDATIVGLPVLVSFVCWSTASWVIVGHPFEQFSSQYGNSAQLQVSGLLGTTFGYRFGLEAESLAYVTPLLLLVGLLLLVFGVARQLSARILAPLACLGGALGFSLASYLADKTFPNYRFYLMAVPLEVLLVGGLIGELTNTARASQVEGVRSRGKFRQRLIGVATAVLALVLIGPSLPATAAGMFNPYVAGGEETSQLGFVFHKHLTANDRLYKNTYAGVLTIGNYIDGLNLPNGDIVVDTFTSCIPFVYISMSQPKVFVIPPDRDFEKILADPLTFHAHYLLLPNPTQGLGQLEEINKVYPTLYQTGAGFAKLAHQFPQLGECPPLRLYRVVGHPPLN